MEAIGTLAGGIAHDFNNILGNILGNDDLVQQILAFSRRQPTTLRVMSLTPLVEESVRLLRALLPGGVRIEYRVLPTPPRSRPTRRR